MVTARELASAVSMLHAFGSSAYDAEIAVSVAALSRWRCARSALAIGMLLDDRECLGSPPDCEAPPETIADWMEARSEYRERLALVDAVLVQQHEQLSADERAVWLVAAS